MERYLVRPSLVVRWPSTDVTAVSLGKPRSALLEKLCSQTQVLLDMLSEDGGPGAFVNLQQDYLH